MRDLNLVTDQKTCYSETEAIRLTGLSKLDLRALVTAGLIQPATAENPPRFTFQDLVVMRTSSQLRKSGIGRKRIQRALRTLQLKSQSLTTVRLWSEGNRIVAQKGARRWHPESGQQLLSFDDLLEGSTTAATPIRARAVAEDATVWFERACALEADAPREAISAYRQALQLVPDGVDSHLNLGRLLHEQGDLSEAEQHYRAAVALSQDDPLCFYNLGVVLEDQKREAEAIEAYEEAVTLDPLLRDAHFNLARVYERKGQRGSALRHFSRYRRLSR